MYGLTPSTPRAAIAAGVLATGKRLRVAALTARSVVCAESITATSSSKGVVYRSSVVGDGLAACSRRKIALRVAGCMVGLRFRRVLAGADECRPLRLAGEEPGGVRSIACAIFHCARCRWGVRQCGPRYHGDAVDRAGRDTELTTGAQRQHHRVHLPVCADDGVDRAGRQALGAADAGLLVDLRDERRALGAVRRVEGQHRS